MYMITHLPTFFCYEKPAYNRMTIESNNTMTFEVMVSQDKPIRASGNGMHNGENIPEVNSYFITAYQRANLKRM